MHKKKEARRKNDRPLGIFYCKLIGTRLSSHDLLNLELRHHQLFAILIICCLFYDFGDKSICFFSNHQTFCHLFINYFNQRTF